jgi:hypothetical protein
MGLNKSDVEFALEEASKKVVCRRQQLSGVNGYIAISKA